MWQGRARSWCRCGRENGPRPSAAAPCCAHRKPRCAAKRCSIAPHRQLSCDDLSDLVTLRVAAHAPMQHSACNVHATCSMTSGMRRSMLGKEPRLRRGVTGASCHHSDAAKPPWIPRGTGYPARTVHVHSHHAAHRANVSVQSQRSCGRSEPGPGADVGRGEPSPGADVGRGERSQSLSRCGQG